MVTNSLIPIRGARRRTVAIAPFLAAAAVLLSIGSSHTPTHGPAVSPAAESDLTEIEEEYERLEELEELEGRVPTHQLYRPDAVEAAFARESYRPGSVARLLVTTSVRRLRVRIYRAGAERFRTRRSDVMNGVPMTSARTLRLAAAPSAARIEVGDWPSGLYFARLSAPGGRVGFAPFVVRPRRLGENRVAVVLPTFTWQAYNFRDDDRDGTSDTWYAGWRSRTVRLARPFLDRGVPPHYRVYDLPFLNWLARTGREVDVLTDSDLDTVASGRRLAAAYDLVIFPGHHEYVTTHEYDVVTEYRNSGGNLAFLSANNFFWQVIRRGNTITRTKQWRDLGRPEAALIGVQYRANDRGGHRGPWIVRQQPAARGLFTGMCFSAGGRFSNGGIEIDSTTSASPRGTQVIAEIPNIYGPGFTAQMTYYETRAGAKVFAAGAFTLAGAVRQLQVSSLLTILWARLTDPGEPARRGR